MIPNIEVRRVEGFDIWAALAAPLPSHAIEWRIDSKPTARDGKFFARFVPYVTTQYVRERFDAVVPGVWSLHIDREADAADKNGVVTYVYHASITVSTDGSYSSSAVTREDVGEGESPKVAATDAFKRAAMRFGIAHELYSFGQNWVQVDGDGKFAKPVEDPQAAYERKQGAQTITPRVTTPAPHPAIARAEAAVKAVEAVRTEERPAPAGDVPACPVCGGKVWDNRADKKNPRAPDFKCRDKSCDGVIWPPKNAPAASAPAAAPASYASINSAMDDDEKELPF